MKRVAKTPEHQARYDAKRAEAKRLGVVLSRQDKERLLGLAETPPSGTIVLGEDSSS